MLSSYGHDDKVAPVIFKMSNFSENINCGHVWYSRPFLAFDKGCRMRLVVCGYYVYSECNHLVVPLYLMKGPYDDELEQSGHWPMSGTFRVELLNQLSDHYHYITFNDTICSECSNRVLEGDMVPNVCISWQYPTCSSQK